MGPDYKGQQLEPHKAVKGLNIPVITIDQTDTDIGQGTQQVHLYSTEKYRVSQNSLLLTAAIYCRD